MYTQQERTQLEQAIVWLSDRCDGASSEDGLGFNKLDSSFGHSLACQIKEGRSLSQNQQAAAQKMIAKYHRQLSHAGLAGCLLHEVEEVTGEVEQIDGDIITGELASDDDCAIALPKSKPGIELNPGQAKAVQAMAKFVESRDPWFVLTGAAGTGKSSTIQFFTEWYQAYKKVYVCFAAPTNKAVKVLKRMAGAKGLHNIDFYTIYQLLGMKLEVDDDGNEKPVRDPNGSVSIDQYDLIVCDEASMLASPILEELKLQTRKGKPKVVFMGDPNQLPPVGEKLSAVFEVEKQAALTEVMRFGEAIGLTVSKIRENLTGDLPLFRSVSSTDGEIIVSDKFDWLDDLVACFKSEPYQVNPDHCKAIAWRNKTVDWINKFVRDQLFDRPDQFMPDERVIALKPVIDGREILMTTSSEANIISASDTKKRIILDLPRSPQASLFDEFDIQTEKTYQAWALILLTEDGHRIRCTAIDDCDRAQLDLDLQQLRSYAGKFERGSRDCKTVWREYFRLRNYFAPLGYAYAITVHKSQGSTFNHAFVAADDLKGCKEVEQRNRLFYVACSRASEVLHLSK